MDLVTIKTFTDSNDANICKGRLESEGIQCFLANESFIGANPLLQNAAGGYKLQCAKTDAEKALTVLGEK
jgi:hypothetical protein